MMHKRDCRFCIMAPYQVTGLRPWLLVYKPTGHYIRPDMADVLLPFFHHELEGQSVIMVTCCFSHAYIG